MSMKASFKKYFTIGLHHNAENVNESLHKRKVRSHLTKVA